MISELLFIAGSNSTTNLKTYEHAKNFFNPANTQSPSEGSLNEKRHRVTGMWYVVPFHLLRYANTGILS